MQCPPSTPWTLTSVRDLRRPATGPAPWLWSRLRGRALGVAFRRQARVGPYVVDFFAPAARLVVEVDREARTGEAARAAARRTVLEALGLRVVCVSAADTRHGLDAAVRRIADAVAVPAGPAL